ncbi:hypothetical protein TSOC_002159, partial [Tetrabaena socialis]
QLDKTQALSEQLGIVLMIAVFILYPGWAHGVFSVFACYHIDDGASGPFPERQRATWGWGYWIRDMNAQCYAGTHLSLYLPIGVVAFHLFCLAPPLVFYALLWCKRKQLSTLSTIQRFGFLFTRYRPKYFWWESVLMLQELSLVAVEVFGRALADVSQQILLMLAAFILISINMSCSPIKSHLITLLEFLSMAVLSLTLTLSLYFVVGEELDPGLVVRLAAMLSEVHVLQGLPLEEV